MKQKTAIRQLIEKLQEAKENFPAMGFDDEFVRGFDKAFQMAIFISEKFEPVNEQQIKDAYSAAGHEYYDKSFNETTSVAWFNKRYEKP